DLALDLANAVEGLIETNAVGHPDLPFEPRDVVAERIEQSVSIAQCCATALGAFAFAEEALEHDARMRLGRKRRRWRRPGETILIDARVAVVAHAGERVQIHRQLERRQLPVAAHLLRRNLVDGGAEM